MFLCHVFCDFSGSDTLIDYNVKDDQIVILGSKFTGGLKAGLLPTDAFHLGTAAQTKSDRIYNRSAGKLLFDVDGKGGTSAIELAHLKLRT